MKNSDQHSNGILTINSIARELCGYARAFDVTGNQKMAGVLLTLSQELLDATEVIGEAYTNNLVESYHNAQKNAGSVLTAVLTGIKIGNNNQS